MKDIIFTLGITTLSENLKRDVPFFVGLCVSVENFVGLCVEMNFVGLCVSVEMKEYLRCYLF